MKIIYKFLVRFVSFLLLGIVILISVFGWLSYSEGKHCGALKEKAAVPEIEAYLTDWVDGNLSSVEFKMLENIRLGGGAPGGVWWYKNTFPWNGIGFKEESQIRIISRVIPENTKHKESIESLFFGEVSGRGYLVRPKYSKTFGVNEKNLHVISERLAVVCMLGGL